MKSQFYSHGKLLIAGEYVVLDGALALGVPTRQGQWMEVLPGEGPGLEWVSLDFEGHPWMETRFSIAELLEREQPETLPDGNRDRLAFILREMETQCPGFLRQTLPVRVETRLEFPRQWGLGSSSTLLNNLARWAGIDPFTLSEKTLGGSGYDLACAASPGPIFYRRNRAGQPEIHEAPFRPVFKDSLYFLYLGQKQDSREGIALYRERAKGKTEVIRELSAITRRMAATTDLSIFRAAMDTSEELLSKFLGLPRVKDLYFADFDGSVKSLGAWGGDFALVAGGDNPPEYFAGKGFTTLLPYREMILEES